MVVTIFINVADFWKLNKKKLLQLYMHPDAHEKLMEQTLLPMIGSIRLSELTENDLKGLFRTLQDAGMTAYLQQIAIAMLRRLCQLAVEARLMKCNPADSVKVCPTESKPVRALTPEQEMMLLLSFKYTSRPALYTLLLITGLPFREIAGCRKEDFFPEEGKLRILRDVIRCGLRDKPKQEQRTIQLPEPARRILQKIADETEKDNDFLFHGDDGQAMTRIPRRDYHIIQERSGLPEIRAEDWIHNFGIRALQLGVNPKILNKYMGYQSGKRIMRYTAACRTYPDSDQTMEDIILELNGKQDQQKEEQ